MPLVFQGIAILIVVAVLYSVIVEVVSAHRRERCRKAVYEELQRGLYKRIQHETEKWEIQKRPDEQTWQGFRKLEVRKKVHLGESGICEFELVPRDGRPLPPYKPGQFLTFKVVIGRDKKSAVRCYSLSDRYRKKDMCYRVSIKKLSHPPGKPDVPHGLVSSYFHDQVEVGEILDVRAPAGHFVLDVTQESPVVLVAAGVGITPLWSMLTEIVETQPRRTAWLFYGVRHGGEQLFREEIEEIKSKYDNVHIRICYSQPRKGDTEKVDYDHDGRANFDYVQQELPSNEFEFFICGPRGMMRELTQALNDWKVPKSNIRTEAFSAPEIITSPRSENLMVTFAKSNREIPWNATMSSLLELAEENDVPMKSGCRAGSCGECEVAIRAGEVEYVREAEADCEEHCCLACIAVPKSNVVIEA